MSGGFHVYKQRAGNLMAEFKIQVPCFHTLVKKIFD